MKISNLFCSKVKGGIVGGGGGGSIGGSHALTPGAFTAASQQWDVENGFVEPVYNEWTGDYTLAGHIVSFDLVMSWEAMKGNFLDKISAFKFVQMSWDRGTEESKSGTLRNNYTKDIYFKPENDDYLTSWGAYPLHPGASTILGVDAINVNGEVYKIENGYIRIDVFRDGTVNVIFDQFYDMFGDATFYKLDKAFLDSHLYKSDGTHQSYEWPPHSGLWVNDTSWWNIFNPDNLIRDPRR